MTGGAGKRVTEPTGSDLRHASIDGKIYTGDVRAFIGGEERDCCGDSSGMPLRPIGICVVNCATACAACSAVRPVVVAKAGVSIAPGLIQFTRILRSFNSKAQPRAKLRTAALLAA